MSKRIGTVSEELRRLAVRHAVASSQLEGLTPSSQVQAGLARYSAGKVSVADLIEEARRKYAR